MKPKNRWYFTTSCLTMIAFGAFMAIYLGILALASFQELKYSFWLDINSPCASLTIGAFSGAFGVFGGLYGLLAKDSKMKCGGCFAIASITIAYYTAALVIRSFSLDSVWMCAPGIVISLLFVASAHLIYREQKKAHEEQKK